jgi:membrane fusion protein (multidrug efflux system)
MKHFNFLKRLEYSIPGIHLVATACLLASCGNKSNTAAPPEAKPYGVITIVPRTTVIYSDFPATIQGQQNVEIRPQIDGYMQALYVDEGSVVKKGQLLIIF